MTREEKIQHLSELINVSGNVTKLIRFVIMQTAENSDVPESKIDEIIAILTAES